MSDPIFTVRMLWDFWKQFLGGKGVPGRRVCSGPEAPARPPGSLRSFEHGAQGTNGGGVSGWEVGDAEKGGTDAAGPVEPEAKRGGAGSESCSVARPLGQKSEGCRPLKRFYEGRAR